MTTGGLQLNMQAQQHLQFCCPDCFPSCEQKTSGFNSATPEVVCKCAVHTRISTVSNFVNSVATCVVSQRRLSLSCTRTYICSGVPFLTRKTMQISKLYPGH